MTGAEYLNRFLADELSGGPTFRKFSLAERRAMMEDDLFAGRSVSRILGAIVIGGTLLMLGTVAIALLARYGAW
jgi:hypothetical protein